MKVHVVVIIVVITTLSALSNCSDIATRNCMLMSDLRVKIGDYGIGEDLFRVSLGLICCAEIY